MVLKTPLLLTGRGIDGYAMLDSGEGRKLEQFGLYTVDRPEPQAMWPRRLPDAEWAKAQAVFTGSGDEEEGAGARWHFKGPQPAPFEMGYGKVRFLARFTPFRHLGFFPDQAPHWDYMLHDLKGKDQPKLLNLFGYTGVASLLAAQAGAHVTHVDASKKAIGFGRESQTLAKLDDKPIRWIVDDAMKFAAREVRRGNKYDGILLDPPKYGRGPDGETWDFYTSLPELLKEVAQLVKPDGFVILNAYAIRASFVTLHDMLSHYLPKGEIEAGELLVGETARDLHIPTAIFARWKGKA
jgi:23S rRNA (cytosine1962-C5)-methyltransferase